MDERTHFAPLVRGEIGGFAWHLLTDLPATKEAATLAYHTPDGSRHKFYMVHILPHISWLAAYLSSHEPAEERSCR